MKKLLFFIFSVILFSSQLSINAQEIYEQERLEQIKTEQELIEQEKFYEQEDIEQEEKLQELTIIGPAIDNVPIKYIEGQPLEGILIFEEIVLDNIDSNWYIETKPLANKNIAPEDTIAPIETILAYQNAYSTLFQPDATIYGMKEFSYGNAVKYDNSKFGVKYDNKITPENFEQIRTLYYEYEKNKFLLYAAYKNSSTDITKKKQNSKIELENSYRLTDSLALKYVYSTGKATSNSNFLFTFYPFNDESINFDIGAGQKYYADKDEYSSRFLFETEFEF